MSILTKSLSIGGEHQHQLTMMLTIAMDFNVEYNIYYHCHFCMCVSGHACAIYSKHVEDRIQLLDSEGPGIDFYRCS